jgi:hypothetical protein
MKKKAVVTITFLGALSLIAAFLSLKKAGFEDAFSFDFWDEDQNESL